MNLNQAFIAELQQEAANTRKILAAVPFDQASFKPHEKSMAMDRLAVHVAELSSWITLILNTSELNFATMDFKSYKATSSEDLLQYFDTELANALKSLENASNEDFQAPWSMRNGDVTYFTLPKAAVIRTWAFNHAIHHRGQLSVYLRLCNIPVPGMYGPTADDRQ